MSSKNMLNISDPGNVYQAYTKARIKVKVGVSHCKNVAFICFIESPLKWWNCFLFHVKLFLLLKDLSFCPDTLAMKENGLTRDLRLISEFMTPQTRQQTITIHILLIISRSKGNQTMKFGQLIEYKMKNIFLLTILQKVQHWKLVGFHRSSCSERQAALQRCS